MVPFASRLLMLVGLLSLVFTYFLYLALSLPGSIFLPVAMISFQVMLFGRVLNASRREFVMLLIIDTAFLAAGVAMAIQPMNLEFVFGRWDFMIFMTLMTLAFVTAGFLPIRKVDVAEYGLTTAFVVSYFYEMFGFPLTLFFINVFLAKDLPLSGFLGVRTAHLWVTLGLMDYTAAHLFSGLVLVAGTLLLVVGHWTLYRAKGDVVTGGIYRYLKHPQYVGIILIAGGMLIEYPTFLGLAMWATLLLLYVNRARHESREISS
jgi:protein-S-isoprenylcysteine O-methyltransferase Ste14